MNNDKRSELLKRRAEGSLTAEEEEWLRERCGCDEVMSAAFRRAGIIRKRRWMVASVAVVLTAGAVVATMMRPTDEQSLLATSEVAPVVVPAEEYSVPVVNQTTVEAVARPEKKSNAKRTAPKAKQQSQPVVLCNSQCEADSVISDIWKFLSA